MEYFRKHNAIRDPLNDECTPAELSCTQYSYRFAHMFTIRKRNNTTTEHAGMPGMHVLNYMILSSIVLMLTLSLCGFHPVGPELNSSNIITASKDNNTSGFTSGECRDRCGNKESVPLKPSREYYNKLVYIKSNKYNVEPMLVSAMIKVESNWNYKVVSRSGAIGLMQLMPSTARAMDVKDPLNPEENIEGGIKYLRYLLDRFDGDLILAIAAYNAGPTKVRRYNGIPPIRETQQYVKRVLAIYNGSDLDKKIS